MNSFTRCSKMGICGWCRVIMLHSNAQVSMHDSEGYSLGTTCMAVHQKAKQSTHGMHSSRMYDPAAVTGLLYARRGASLSGAAAVIALARVCSAICVHVAVSIHVIEGRCGR